MKKGGYIIPNMVAMLLVVACTLFSVKANVTTMNKAYNQAAVATDNIRIYKDIRYGDRERNILDIYIPSALDKEQQQGVVLFLHGGSWSAGDKSSMEDDCLALAGKGYMTAAMNYSFIGKEDDEMIDFATMTGEIATALSTIKEHAAREGIEVDKAALSGYSAGAHLAMLYGYSMVEQSPIPVVLVESKAGPADFSTFSLDSNDAKELLGKMGYDGTSPEELTKNEAVVGMFKAFSPLSYVRQGIPATLLAYGKMDSLVTWENVKLLVEAFTAAGVEYTLVEYPNSGHGLDKDPRSVQRTDEAMIEYLQRCFGY